MIYHPNNSDGIMTRVNDDGLIQAFVDGQWVDKSIALDKGLPKEGYLNIKWVLPPKKDN